MKTERSRCAGLLKAAVAYYKSLGVIVLRVMTTCWRLKLKHIQTKP